MRLDGAGNPLESVPFEVTAGRASQQNPRAAWNGTSWLVVYESYDFGGTGYYRESLEALRVGSDGRVLDPEPIKIFNVTPVGATWAVASDGTSWVIAIQGTSASNDIIAVRGSSSGVLLDPGPRSLVPGTYDMRGGFHLAYAGGVFLLAYEESMTGHDPTSAIRFDAGLNPLDPAPYSLVGTPLSRLVSNGSNFYAVWNEQLPDWTMAVKGSRIGTNGQKLDGGGVNISGPNEPQSYTTTSVAWDGGNWKVTWGGPGGTRLARVLDPGGALVAGAGTGLTASAGNGSVQVARSDFVTSNYEVFTQHISSGNVAGPSRTLSLGAPSQLRVDIATSGSGSMMVYRSSTASRNRVLVQPLDAGGNPLTAQPIELDAAVSPDHENHPPVGETQEPVLQHLGARMAASVREQGAQSEHLTATRDPKGVMPSILRRLEHLHGARSDAVQPLDPASLREDRRPSTVESRRPRIVEPRQLRSFEGREAPRCARLAGGAVEREIGTERRGQRLPGWPRSAATTCLRGSAHGHS